MHTIGLRRTLALITGAALLASLTVAAPASAAKPKCAGKTATIVGTSKGERIVGTNRRDVIVAKGGNDRIYGRGGNDLICAGNGNDIVSGGPGIDRLYGAGGRDRIFGGPGPDRLFGGPAPDKLDGGVGRDACFQGSGAGPRLRCELPLTGPKLLAIAYSDLDGNHRFAGPDVLISKLVDSNGDGIPSVGDTIMTDRYPTTPTPASAADFADWEIKVHTVTRVSVFDADRVVLGEIAETEAGDPYFAWYKHSPAWNDRYYEGIDEAPQAYSEIDDAKGSGLSKVFINISSPSKGMSVGSNVPGAGDDRLIDVEIYP